MPKLPLHYGNVVVDHALVDSDDYERLREFRWKTGAARAAGRPHRPSDHVRQGYRTLIADVLQLPYGQGVQPLTEHINGNGFDFRKSNLAKRSPLTHKMCPGCSTTQPKERFRDNRRLCRSCEAARRATDDEAREKSRTYRERERERYRALQRAWLQKNPERARILRLKGRLRREYGLTVEDFERMMAECGGVCTVCGSDNGGRLPCVDHNAATGAVRGLLCHNCNVALGLTHESPEVLRALADYIETHKEARQSA